VTSPNPDQRFDPCWALKALPADTIVKAKAMLKHSTNAAHSANFFKCKHSSSTVIEARHRISSPATSNTTIDNLAGGHVLIGKAPADSSAIRALSKTEARNKPKENKIYISISYTGGEGGSNLTHNAMLYHIYLTTRCRTTLKTTLNANGCGGVQPS
jgi:hypothetical protein